MCYRKVTRIKELIHASLFSYITSIFCHMYKVEKNKRVIQVRVNKLLKNNQEIKRLIEARSNFQVISTQLGHISLQEYGLKGGTLLNVKRNGQFSLFYCTETEKDRKIPFEISVDICFGQKKNVYK